MNEYDRGGFQVKHLLLTCILLMTLVAGYVGWRMSDEALTLLTGVVIGAAGLGVPAWIMAVMAHRALVNERAQNADRGPTGPRPPLVVVQGGATQKSVDGWEPPPQLANGWGNDYGGAYAPSQGEPAYPPQVHEFGER